MNDLEKFLAVLAACGGHREELGKREGWKLAQQWREVYAARLHDATGKWKHGPYEWHAFTFGHAPALEGRKAMAEYQVQAASPFIIIPEESRGVPNRVVRVTSGSLPRFDGSGLDLLVSPEGLSWTMAFTHEEGYCGPFFSKREWLSAGRS